MQAGYRQETKQADTKQKARPGHEIQPLISQVPIKFTYSIEVSHRILKLCSCE